MLKEKFKRTVKTEIPIHPDDGAVQLEGISQTAANPTVRSFKDLGVNDLLCEACLTLGYKSPTPIQCDAIPLAFQGRDLIGIAETGSGKTAAFALPILQGNSSLE